ncbi:MAG: hypothetical protein GY841_05130, partial [FCB group bacterium]|nr:hypothetical protein [FCB group bacterium]
MDIDSIRSSLSSTLVQVKRHNISLPLILESKIETIDLLSWLAGQPEPVKFYWADRDGTTEIAGVGNAFTLYGNPKSSSTEQAGRINDILNQQQPIFLSARRFDCSRSLDSLWQPFPVDVCYIPERLILRDSECYKYRICLPVETETDMEDLIAEAQRMNFDPARQSDAIKTDESYRPVASSSEPDSDRWRESVNHVLRAIKTNLVQKTVLARRTDYRFEKKIDPVEFLYSLNRHNRRCYAAMYQIDPERAFISVSPERFYRRIENRIELDALSSTAPRGDSKLQDSQFENNLRQSDKERREHQFVIEGVAQTISELGLDDPVIGETAVLKLDQVQHLWTPVTATLQPSIT